MKISRETLHQLIENKLCQAGLKREHAATVAEVLVYADARGIHSHGAVRVEYYAERISKGGKFALYNVSITKKRKGTSFL